MRYYCAVHRIIHSGEHFYECEREKELAKMPSSCVFCNLILDGLTVECFDNRTVYRFEPLNPVVSGHRLFVSRVHSIDAADSPVITSRVFECAARYGKEQKEAFNLIVNNGYDAGQTIMHLHVHYVPRREGDGLIMPWTAQQKGLANG